MTTFTDFLNDTAIINESSMTRFLRQFQKFDAAIITAFRDGNTKSENRALNKELFSALYAAEYSITRVDGSYIENHNTPQASEVSEDSYVVVNYKNKPNFHGTIKKLGTHFNQDSVLLISSGDVPTAVIFGTNDAEWPGFGKSESVGRLSLTSGNPFFTRLRNKQFAFLETPINESSYINVPLLEPTSRNAKHACVAAGDKILRSIETGV